MPLIRGPAHAAQGARGDRRRRRTVDRLSETGSRMVRSGMLAAPSVDLEHIEGIDLRNRLVGGAYTTPEAPSVSSRRMSAWPACRAVSSITWT